MMRAWAGLEPLGGQHRSEVGLRLPGLSTFEKCFHVLLIGSQEFMRRVSAIGADRGAKRTQFRQYFIEFALFHADRTNEAHCLFAVGLSKIVLITECNHPPRLVLACGVVTQSPQRPRKRDSKPRLDFRTHANRARIHLGGLPSEDFEKLLFHLRTLVRKIHHERGEKVVGRRSRAILHLGRVALGRDGLEGCVSLHHYFRKLDSSLVQAPGKNARGDAGPRDEEHSQ
jgi:hypothetical protein